MKITQNQITQIRDLFNKMNSKNDFLELLNTAKIIIYSDKAIPFEEKNLNYYINYRTKKKPSYYSFTIKKKSGKDRTIHAPVKGLKEFQKALNVIIQCVYEPHSAATGFIIGKSIVDNAQIHSNQNYVYNIDLKDFFPSIDKSRVWGRLLSSPFNLNSSEERKKIANMIAAICCTPMLVERFENEQWLQTEKSVLPQGAPTSPTITNAICERLDIRLNGVAKRFGLSYSRYADDITFSSKHNTYINDKEIVEHIYSQNSSFDEEIRRIIKEQNFHINESKVRLQKTGYRQEVTGLAVNEKVNVNHKYSNQLRQWLFYWETFGYERAYSYFIQKYAKDKGHIKKGQPNMMLVLDGKLLYLKMVKGENDSTYLKLKERIDNLVGITEPEKQNKTKTSGNIVDLIFEIGLEKAMKKY